MEKAEKEELNMNVEGMDSKKSGEELVKRERIDNSPFEVVTVDGYSFGAMGDYRVTEKCNSIEEVKEELSEITWNRVIQVVMILQEIKEKMSKLNKKNKKK